MYDAYAGHANISQKPVIFCAIEYQHPHDGGQADMHLYSGINVEEDIYHGVEILSAPIHINCCGFQDLSGFDCAMKRCRKDFYLVYLVNGTGHFRFGMETIAPDTGSVILYKPGEMQDYYYLGSEKAKIYWIHFSGSDAGKLLDDLSLSQKRICKIGMDTGCIGLFESIIHELQIKKPNYHLLCIGYFYQLLSELSRQAVFLEKGEGVFKNSGIEKVIKLMHEEYAADHNIGYYAKICNLSIYQFIRCFKEAAGFPPAKYLEKIRISKARELLVNSSLTISEISAMVGYHDAFYFSKVYKKVMDAAPSRFRTAEQKHAYGT
jgi:AraC family transcriptional regulator, arabinose operon regulatory protein